MADQLLSMMDESVDAGPAEGVDADSSTQVEITDLLVAEVSIDGMCGVY